MTAASVGKHENEAKYWFYPKRYFLPQFNRSGAQGVTFGPY